MSNVPVIRYFSDAVDARNMLYATALSPSHILKSKKA